MVAPACRVRDGVLQRDAWLAPVVALAAVKLVGSFPFPFPELVDCSTGALRAQVDAPWWMLGVAAATLAARELLGVALRRCCMRRAPRLHLLYGGSTIVTPPTWCQRLVMHVNGVSVMLYAFGQLLASVAR